MDLFQQTKLVNANTTGDKGLIQTRGRRTMRNLKMTISVIDVEIFRILPRINVHLSIWLLCIKWSLKEVKPAGDTRYEAHFNLASEAVLKESCSNQVPKEQVNNNSLNIEENLPSTDNMLLDFGSGDMFGDLE